MSKNSSEVGKDLASQTTETLRAAVEATDGQSRVVVESVEEVGRCEVEWERPKGVLCKPHQCDLLAGHKGKHVCDCGWARRNMKRDQPDE